MNSICQHKGYNMYIDALSLIVSILETIFCEFWSIATTVKKIFDKLCNFLDD